MNKFFTKTESDLLISLFNSKDFENYKLGMNLIFTHKHYKSLCKLIVVRYPRIQVHEYKNISVKYSFGDLVKIYKQRVKNNWWDTYESNKFFKLISEFVKKRTNEKRT